jgi:hypothetical protein
MENPVDEFRVDVSADGTVFMYTQTEQSLTGRKNRGL